MAIKVIGDPCPRFSGESRGSAQSPHVLTPSVNTKARVNGTKKADRHSPGYMAEYMRKRRAAKKA